LVAYLVPRDPAAFDPEPVRAHAADALPSYMVPSAFEVLPALPLTAGGKVNRAGLPEPRTTGGGTAPAVRPAQAGPYEAEVAEVFSHVLDAPVREYDADFVALGGTSLQISRVIARISREYDIGLPAEAWLRAPTVEGFARLVDAYLRDGGQAARDAADDLDFDLALDDDILTGLTKGDSRVHH
jgi:acyl carrier protein